MFYHYDPMARALYVTLSDAPIQESMELHPNIVADYASDGTMVGLEILDVGPATTPTAPDHPVRSRTSPPPP